MVYRSGYVSIDATDVLHEIEDDDLLEECRKRKLLPTMVGPREAADLDIVREAHAELSRGRIVEARIILDRLLYPKWKSAKSCQKQFDDMLEVTNGHTPSSAAAS